MLDLFGPPKPEDEEKKLQADALASLLGDEFSDMSRQKAVAQADEQKKSLGWREALAAFGQGIAGRDPMGASRVFDQKRADIDAQTTGKFDQGKKDKLQAYMTGQQLKKMQRDETETAALDDPNSEASKSIQDIASQLSNGKSYAGVSGSKLQAILPRLETLYRLKQDKETKALANDAKAAEKSRLSDKQVGEVTDFDQAINATNNILAEKKINKWDTGPLSMRLNDFAAKLGWDDADKSAFKANVGEQLAQYIKSISGATVSPTEREALLKNVPSVYDNDATFERKAQALKSRLEEMRYVKLQNLKRVGKNTSEFETPIKSGGSSQGAGSVVRVKGKTYRVGADGDTLEPI